MARVNTSGPSKSGIQNSSYTYAADAQVSDAYAITVSPAPSAYAAGQRWLFKANTANTGAASLNVNSLGAVTIKKNTDQDLATGDIEAGSIVEVVHDGTNFQMVSVGAVAPGTGDVTGPASSVDSEIALFSGTGGKTLKRASGTGVLRVDSGVASVDSDVTDLVSAASESAAGKVELATATEINTGTDATRAISPDTLAGSQLGKRVIQVKVFDDATAATTGDGKLIFMIPVELNGMNLVDVEAYVTGVSSSGALTVQVRNVTQAADMLSTAITIDQSENTSLTAATPPVIDTGNDDVATGDLIAIDVDGAGTSAEGLGVVMSFQLP